MPTNLYFESGIDAVKMEQDGTIWAIDGTGWNIWGTGTGSTRGFSSRKKRRIIGSRYFAASPTSSVAHERIFSGLLIVDLFALERVLAFET
jgi:hypothetical protein